MDKSILNKRSQELGQYYRLNGAIYLCNTDRIKKEKTFFIESSCIAYKMNQEQSVDIDTRFDFLQALFLINLTIW